MLVCSVEATNVGRHYIPTVLDALTSGRLDETQVGVELDTAPDGSNNEVAARFAQPGGKKGLGGGGNDLGSVIAGVGDDTVAMVGGAVLKRGMQEAFGTVFAVKDVYSCYSSLATMGEDEVADALASQADEVCAELWLMLQHMSPCGLPDMSAAVAAKIPREPTGLPPMIHVLATECKLLGPSNFSENYANAKKRFDEAGNRVWQGMFGKKGGGANNRNSNKVEGNDDENVYFELQFNSGRKVRSSPCIRVQPGQRTQVNAAISTRYLGEDLLHIAARRRVGEEPSAADDLFMGPKMKVNHGARARSRKWSQLDPGALAEKRVALNPERGQHIALTHWLTDGDRRSKSDKQLRMAWKALLGL